MAKVIRKYKIKTSQCICINLPAVQLLCSVKSLHFKVTERQAETSISPLGRVPDGQWDLFIRTEESMLLHMTLLFDCVFFLPQGCESWEHTAGRRWICSDRRCVSATVVLKTRMPKCRN